MNASADVSPTPAPLITRRMLWGLGLIAVVHAAVVCGAALPESPLAAWPFSTPAVLPYLLVGVAIGLGLLLTPAWAEESAEPDNRPWRPQPRRERLGYMREQLARAAFLAAWQAAALGYFLLAVSRLTPLEGGPLLRVLLVIGATLGLAFVLAVRFARAYAGLVFLWVVAAPVGCFVTAEVFVSTPAGAAGWTQATGPGAQVLREVVSWLLRLSPCTAAVGALNGEVLGGGPFGWAETALFVAVCVAGLVALLRRA